MPSKLAYGLLTLIQERAKGILLDRDLRIVTVQAGGPLLALLNDDSAALPAGLGLDLSKVIDRVVAPDVLGTTGEKALLGRVRASLSEAGRGLLEGQGLKGLAERLHALLAGVSAERVVGLVGRQAAIGMSFVTTLHNLTDLELASRIPEGWARYFFADEGFETVDGIAILSPGHGAIAAAVAQSSPGAEGWKQLKGLVSERRAEQYVRDLIRITVEVAGDARYDDVRARHGRMLDQMHTAAAKAKAARWFRGFGSLAESMVTSAVEEAALGVAQFQTNPVLAAAAATYAGTVARKATQHVFLSEVGV
jgi:hypothetical protein